MMNDDLNELERLIANQPVREPSAELDARVEATCGEERGRRLMLPWMTLVGGLAACLTIVGLIALFNRESQINTGSPGKDHVTVIPNGNHAPATTAKFEFEPVRIEQVWQDVKPVGIVEVEGDSPVRRFHRQTFEHVQLIDDKRNIRIEYTLPREEVIVMPLRYD